MCIGNTATKLTKPGKITEILSKYTALVERLQQIGNMCNGGVAGVRSSVRLISQVFNSLYKI
jgi:HD superfamily phosphodiesterase